MSKTQLSSAVKVGRKTFTTNAKPDPYDFRDLEYRPVLQPLDPSVHADRQDAAFTVLTQEGQSCTGHAVAATINTVLTRSAQRTTPTPQVAPVSPYMLYRLARRYDDSQRRSGRRVAAARRVQGLASPRRRPGPRMEPAGGRSQGRAPRRGHRPRRARLPGLVPAATAGRLLPGQRLPARRHAVGHQRAPCDRGLGRDPRWLVQAEVRQPPARALRGDRPRRGAQPKGGHAFALVGYNEIGFLVQNSWGPDWGDHGFSILTYEDWLPSAYDAWVARPGVPNTPFARPRRRRPRRRPARSSSTAARTCSCCATSW